MHQRLFGAVFACAALLSAPALAEDPSTTAVVVVPTTTTVAPTPAASDPGDEIICKTTPPPLGTRIGGQRICGKRRDWADMEHHAKDWVHDTQFANVGNPGVKGGGGP